MAPAKRKTLVAPAHEALIRTLGHRFSRPELLQEAMTHRSCGAGNNERLEFLGDSILNFVVAGILFERFPGSDEGELSRLRAQLVRRDTLAAVGKRYALGDYLRLGPGELKSGGYRRESILADAVEAIIGAVYLDSGIEAASSLVRSMLTDHLAEISLEGPLKDPKTRLQELLQSQGLPLPQYDVVAVDGKEHDQTFHVVCRVHGIDAPIAGTGASRRRSEQDAAQKALRALGRD